MTDQTGGLEGHDMGMVDVRSPRAEQTKYQQRYGHPGDTVLGMY